MLLLGNARLGTSILFRFNWEHLGLLLGPDSLASVLTAVVRHL